MPKHGEKIRHICLDCGKEFYTVSRNALRCEGCRIIRNKYTQREAKRRNKVQNMQRAISSRKSLSRVLRELAEYNKEHNTLLTYGQYVALMEKGEY